MKKIIACMILCVLTLVSYGQCESAGNDTTVYFYVQEPFTLNSCLSPNASLNGSWYASWNTPSNPLGTDTLSFNFPGQVLCTYIVTDTVCNTSDTSTIIIIFNPDWGWGIDEQTTESITIYPNPTTRGVFTLSKELEYTIEDATGNQIYQITNAGVYFVVVRQKRYKLINL